MSFNFGATPFKHNPVEDFVAFDQAPSSAFVENAKGGSSAPTRKIVPNAPQAIIIEVLYNILICLGLVCSKVIIYYVAFYLFLIVP